MKKSLFIAINIPPEAIEAVRQLLQADSATYPDLYANARMTPSQDWHITVLYLGEQEEHSIDVIERIITDVARQITIPQLAIKMLTTAPPHRPPRMIWATLLAESNTVLGTFKKGVLQELANHAIHPQGEQFANFNGHITLARLPEGRKIADHAIALAHTIPVPVARIDIMETHLESTGAKYSIVRSIPLLHE